MDPNQMQPPMPETGEIYWAKKKGSDLLGSLKDKEARYFSSAERRGIKGMWEIAYAQYFGTDPMNPGDMATQVTSRTGPKGKFVRFRINEVRSIIGQQNIIALGERPAFQCLATNSDYQSMSQVEICDSIVDYLYKEANGEERERACLESDGVFGAGYGHIQWDFDGGDEVDVMKPAPNAPPNPDGSPAQVPIKQKSGMPLVTVCYPWEVVQDPGARTMRWVIVRERRSKWEVAAEYPEFADSITKVDVLDEYAVEHMFGFDIDQANSDDCLVKHFYHPRCSALPDGRYVGVCGEDILWDLPCPVSDGVPLVELCSGKYVCSSFGYAGSWDLIGIQEMLDQICSDTASNLTTHGRQVMFYEKGSDFTFDKISEGLFAFGIPPDSQIPQAMNYAQIPDAVKWFAEYLHERHQSLSGLNSVARGDPKANIKSGEMAALFHSIAIEFQSARQAALDGYRERMANLMLDFVRSFGESTFLVEVAGQDERPYLKEFEKTVVSGVKRVRVTTTSPMMRSQQGRMQVFNAIGQLPPDQKKPAYQFIVTGQAKGFTEGPVSSALRIQWENEQLRQGVQCQVLFTDDPWEHIPQHKADLEKLTAAFNDNDPMVEAQISAYTQHIIQHATVYQGMDPRIAACLGIPAPPPIPPFPAFQLAAAAGGMGAPPPASGPGGPGGPPKGGKAGAQPPPGSQATDPTTGTKLPSPSTPPANANVQQPPQAAE
jgi:hypothetical protein